VGHRLEGVPHDGMGVHHLQRRRCWMGVGVPSQFMGSIGMNVKLCCFNFR